MDTNRILLGTWSKNQIRGKWIWMSKYTSIDDLVAWIWNDVRNAADVKHLLSPKTDIGIELLGNFSQPAYFPAWYYSVPTPKQAAMIWVSQPGNKGWIYKRYEADAEPLGTLATRKWDEWNANLAANEARRLREEAAS